MFRFNPVNLLDTVSANPQQSPLQTATLTVSDPLLPLPVRVVTPNTLCAVPSRDSSGMSVFSVSILLDFPFLPLWARRRLPDQVTVSR